MKFEEFSQLILSRRVIQDGKRMWKPILKAELTDLKKPRMTFSGTDIKTFSPMTQIQYHFPDVEVRIDKGFIFSRNILIFKN